MNEPASQRLAGYVTVVSGSTFPVDHQGRVDGDIPFLKVSDMNLPGNGRFIRAWNNSIDDDLRRRLRAPLLPAGTVIFPKIGGAIATNKKRVLTVPSTIDNNVMAAVPREERIDPEFLYFLFLSKDLSDFASSSNPPSIRKPDVEAWRINVPSRDDQRQVIELLTRASNIVNMRREAQRKVEELIPALLHDRFGDPTNNPKGWPVFELGALISSGPQNGLYKHKSAYGSGTPILRIDGFYDGTIRDATKLRRLRLDTAEIDTYELKTEDIVINRVNSPEYLGKSALIPQLLESTVFESKMMRFAVDQERLLPGYLIALLQTQAIREQILSSAKHAINQSSINQQDVKALRVPLPPVAAQRAFVDLAASATSILRMQERALAKAQAAFDALLHRSFAT